MRGFSRQIDQYERHRCTLQHDTTSNAQLISVQVLSSYGPRVLLPPSVHTFSQPDPNPNSKPKPNPNLSQQLHSPVQGVQNCRGSLLVSKIKDYTRRLEMDREEKPSLEVPDRFRVNFGRGIGETRIN